MSSTLTDLIAEAHEAHIFDKSVAKCRCGVEMNRSGHWARERRAHREHLATVTAVLVADWLESDEAAAAWWTGYHDWGEGGALYIRTRAALAAEARKGADQ